ncbi:MAG: flagellar biosynthetic protein FliR [Oscillospiraceae bacterium]|jgi:flagellar biosynthetic protein FliR|nr:flagellar biosynthetic protein FliR [Oscillospiraceae bacterium]
MLISNVDYFLSWVVHFLLIVTRMSALFVFSPLFARQSIPAMAKIGLSLLTAAIIINFAPPPELYPYNSLFSLAFAVISELTVGLVIGFITLLFFNVVYTAAHIIDMQIGLTMAQVFDASIGGQAAVTSTLLNTVLIVSFILSGAFTQLVVMMARTFEVIPVGAGILRPELAYAMGEVFIRTFTMAVQVAMPMLASALILEVALGVIVRTSPQMNVFVVGIPLKIFLGLIVLALMLPVFTSFSNTLFSEMFHILNDVIGGMVP